MQVQLVDEPHHGHNRLMIEFTEASARRFWSRVRWSGECMVWKGSKDDSGYGVVSRGSRYYRAHRVVIHMLRGSIPDGFVVDHLCGQHACVNPDHLETITQRENVLRGRSPAAENAKKKTCKEGHEFERKKNGIRWCRTCTNRGTKARRQKLRERRPCQAKILKAAKTLGQPCTKKAVAWKAGRFLCGHHMKRYRPLRVRPLITDVTEG